MKEFTYTFPAAPNGISLANIVGDGVNLLCSSVAIYNSNSNNISYGGPTIRNFILEPNNSAALPIRSLKDLWVEGVQNDILSLLVFYE